MAEPIAAGSAAEVMGCVGENEAAEVRYRPSEPSCGQRYPSVPFCETLTLHESFDASGVTEGCARICYDVSFLGYTVEELTMKASLPCGGHCMVPVKRITITGAIPYLISVGPVTSGCGGPVDLCIQGVAMVDEVVGYLCGSTDEPDLEPFSCDNVIPCVCASVEPCGCSEKTNVTVCGRFSFYNLPL